MIENEIWKDIKGYERLYQVSSEGRIKRIKDRYDNDVVKYLKNRINNKGYYYIDLSKNNKKERWFNHRLTAIHFIPNPKNLPEVNHKNGDPKKNETYNLEWVSRKENMEHASRMGLLRFGESHQNSKLKEKDIYEIADKLQFRSMCSIAKEYDVTVTTIRRIFDRKTWNYINFFKKIDLKKVENNIKNYGNRIRGANNPNSKLDIIKVKEIKKLKGKKTIVEIAKDFNVAENTIASIFKGITWSWVED